MGKGDSCLPLRCPRRGWRTGQQTAEFALLIGLVASVVVGMQLVVRKAVSQGLQSVTGRTLGYFSANPPVVKKGGSSILRWDVPAATGCAASGGTTRALSGELIKIPGWNGVSKPPKGEQKIENIQYTMTFRLRCMGAKGEPSLVTSITIGDLHATSTQTSTEQGDDSFRRTTTLNGSSEGTAINEVERVRRLPE